MHTRGAAVGVVTWLLMIASVPLLQAQGTAVRLGFGGGFSLPLGEFDDGIHERSSAAWLCPSGRARFAPT